MSWPGCRDKVRLHQANDPHLGTVLPRTRDLCNARGARERALTLAGARLANFPQGIFAILALCASLSWPVCVRGGVTQASPGQLIPATKGEFWPGLSAAGGSRWHKWSSTPVARLVSACAAVLQSLPGPAHCMQH